MDCAKVGNLIRRLRIELGYTQKAVADALNISHKTVSKWERGLGCPDVTLLSDLSVVLGADLQMLLEGRLDPNQPDTGNLSKTLFYVCPTCANIVTGTGKEGISCCGRKLTPEIPHVHLEGHSLTIEEIDGEYYISVDHEMSKKHHIAFIACAGGDRLLLNRLYAEQSCAVRVPIMPNCYTFYTYCTRHGLSKTVFKPPKKGENR